MDRYSTGSQISKTEIIDAFIVKEIANKNDFTKEVEIDDTPKKEKVNLKEIDDRLMTIDDFLN